MLAMVWLLPVPGGPSITNDRPSSAAAMLARCEESASRMTGVRLRRGMPVDVGVGKLVEVELGRVCLWGLVATGSGGEGAHGGVRGDQVLVVEQVPVHRLLGEGEARQDERVVDLPSVLGGDGGADGVQDAGEGDLFGVLEAGQGDSALGQLEGQGRVEDAVSSRGSSVGSWRGPLWSRRTGTRSSGLV